MKQRKAGLEVTERWRDGCFGEMVREGLSVEMTSGERPEWSENTEGREYQKKVTAMPRS